MFKRSFKVLLIALMALCLLTTGASADQYEQDENGNELLIIDTAELFSDVEEEELITHMEPCLRFGHAIVITTDHNDMSTEDLARVVYHDNFGNDSGTLFMIDMDNRYIYIFSDGRNYEIVTDDMADIITDNAYRFASAGDYYGCAAKVFDEVSTILRGEKIAMPMKYISNALLALVSALILNYVFFNAMSAVKRAKNSEILKMADTYFANTHVKVRETGSSRTYSPITSSSSSGGSSRSSSSGSSHSSGGGGSSHSSGGGGSSHSSGGGGGHRF